MKIKSVAFVPIIHHLFGLSKAKENDSPGFKRLPTFTGGGLLTAGSAILTLSNLIAKTYKTNQETQKKIKQSDYSLIYRIKNY